MKIKYSPFSLPKDLAWFIIWGISIMFLVIWDYFFLNRPAFNRLVQGFMNTILISLMVLFFTLAFAWPITLGLHMVEQKKKNIGYFILTFFLNLIRSVPQIVGILVGYVAITVLMERGIFTNRLTIFLAMAFVIGIFVFIEMVDLMHERIEYYRRLDFFNAMLVCGIARHRIINFDILWKNSRVHILNKLISIFGSAIFLQCSIDFIVSVGLSTRINSVNFPPTLGSLLAKLDSKQDILAIGYAILHPGYIGNLFFRHLQGISVAFLIVFTIFCIYNIANAYAERHKL